MNVLERHHHPIKEVMHHDPNRDAEDDGKHSPDRQINQYRFPPPFNGGDDWRSAMRACPRMIADISKAFVTFN